MERRGRGSEAGRPELAKALHLAQLTGATFVLAKLDRLSRSAAFLLALRDSGVRFVAIDMPEANDLTVGIMALVAQAEREAFSRRTKEAIALAKAWTCPGEVESTNLGTRRCSMGNGNRPTPEFRREAVRLALTGGRTRREIAEDLGIGLSTLTRPHVCGQSTEAANFPAPS